MTTHDRIQPRIPALRKFLESEAAGGVLLMAAAALAIIVANSPLGDTYFSLLHHAVGPTLTAKLGPMTPRILLVPVGDHATMATEAHRVLRDAGLAAALRQAGLEQAHTYAWPRVRRQWLDAYRRVAAERRES